MAGKRAELIPLVRRAAALDDAALAALANKGLVRRARKDLEQQRPQYLGSSEGRYQFEIESRRVDLGESPSEARCDCGADSICHHILAVLIDLRDQAESMESITEPESIVDARAEILGITLEDLKTWAGTALFRRSLETVPQLARTQSGATLIIDLIAMNATVRWLPGHGLGGMLCTCHAAGRCEHKVAAVLAIWSQAGRELPSAAPKLLKSAAGAPRSRDEVLESVRHALREMIRLGIGRTSDAARQRMMTLAISAHGVDLPRFERLLRALAEEIALLLKRDAQGATERVLRAAARIWMLAAALANPTAELIGRHRTSYKRVAGQLELIGLGARQWRSRSGYEGLTVYFWDTGSSQWNTWTDARPIGRQFLPVARYRQDMPWEGVLDPCEASRSRYRISGVFRNPAGRLSSRPGVRGVRLGASDATNLPVVRLWTDLLPKLERLFGGGLDEPVEQETIVLLAPAALRDPVFDEIGQTLKRELEDAGGRVLPLLVRYEQAVPEAVHHVESISGDDLVAVLGFLRAGADGFYIEPITLVAKDRLVHVTLDDVEARHAATTAEPPPDEDASESTDEPDTDISAQPRSPVGRLLREILDDLEDVAEAGLHTARDLTSLRARIVALDTLGLATCRRAVSSAVAAIGRAQRSAEPSDDATDNAGPLLTASYVLRQALQMETLALGARSWS